MDTFLWTRPEKYIDHFHSQSVDQSGHLIMGGLGIDIWRYTRKRRQNLVTAGRCVRYCSTLRAAIATRLKVSALNNRNWFSPSSGGQRSDMKVSVEPTPSDGRGRHSVLWLSPSFFQCFPGNLLDSLICGIMTLISDFTWCSPCVSVKSSHFYKEAVILNYWLFLLHYDLVLID